MGVAATWQLDAHAAQVRCSDLSAKLDFSQAARGLHDIRWGEQTFIDGDLLGVSIVERTAGGQIEPRTPWLVADCYSRGPDVVVTFAAEGVSPVRWQVYWSVSVVDVAGEHCPMFDARVSVQTSALDAHLECLLTSRLPGREVSRWADAGGAAERACFLVRPSKARIEPITAGREMIASGHTYIEMVHPDDARQSETPAESTDAPSLRHHLLDTGLEKGVIVRARARGLIAPTRNDRAIAAAAWQMFLSEPPPLTT